MLASLRPPLKNQSVSGPLARIPSGTDSEEHLLADFKVISLGHHRAKETSLTEKVKETAGMADSIDAYIPTLPVVAFMFSDKFKQEYPHVKQVSIQKMLRQREWIVPK